MSRRTLLLGLAAVAVAVALVVGLSQAGGGGGAPKPAAISLQEAQRRLAGSPPPLAALHRRANELVDTDPAAARKRLRALRGYPVVVNKWASWCGPCRFEFPYLQRLSIEYGKRVAFLGVNSDDNADGAAAFASEFPVSFPHLVDPDRKVARALQANGNWPTTAFYDARGRFVTVHQGNYKSEQDLRDAIERYALGNG